MSLYADTSKFMSEHVSELPENRDLEDEGGIDGVRVSRPNDDSKDILKDKQDKRYHKILENFKVLMPEEVEAMLLEDAKKDDQKRKDKERRSHTN